MDEELPGPDAEPAPEGTPPFAAYDQYGWWPQPPPFEAPPVPHSRLFGLRRGVAVSAALGGLVVGGAVGGFVISHAANASTPVGATAASGTSTATPSPSPGPAFRGGLGGFPGVAGVNLLQDAATAIGITEQALQTDLQSGQTVAQVAGANSKTAQDVITALVGDETTAINNLVSGGKITSSQATQIESHLTQMVTAFVNQTRPAAPPSLGFGGSGQQAALQAAATTIGVTPSALESDLASGQTVASVAKAHDVSASTVISAVTTAVDNQISSLESSGKISSSEASALTAEVAARVTEWVDNSYPGWPLGPFGAGPSSGIPLPGGHSGSWWGASPSPSASTT